MITREQVADLRPGDVVELRIEQENLTIRGPLKSGIGTDSLYVGGWAVWEPNPGFASFDDRGDRTLTVISRAPRPLYANHDRTEPTQGDVVRFVDKRRPDDAYTNLFDPRGDRHRPWLQIDGYRWSHDQVLPTEANRHHYDLILLVDGETGQAVTS